MFEIEGGRGEDKYLRTPSYFQMPMFNYRRKEGVNKECVNLMLLSLCLVAYAEIVGAKEKVFKTESRLKLTCLLRDATAAPDYIFW